jgi:predicted AAA+ superfamily ATPase
MKTKTENVEKLKKDELPSKKKNGGARPGSGRKKNLLAEIIKGDLEEVKKRISTHAIQLVQTRKGQKERILVILDKLYFLASHNNVKAMKEYLDRTIGKAKESVDITTGGDKMAFLTVIRDDTRKILSKTDAKNRKNHTTPGAGEEPVQELLR